MAPGDPLHEAVAGAADGDVVELAAGVHVAQTAVVTQRRLTLRGVGGPVVLQADGAHAEGKALLVVRGGEIGVEGLEFRGARVKAGNGAGIRFEQGSLTVRRCGFFDNEMGLLSANLPDAELTIDECRFGQAPHHEGPLHHLLYVGTMRRLTLRASRFSGGWRGHLVKSRASRNHISCNWLVDGDDGEASYELDLPNGGLAWVVGNVIAQGPRPQNMALLAYGAEGPMHADCALYVAHNTFVNDAPAAGACVRHWPERLPAGCELRLTNNLAFGPAVDGSLGDPADGNELRTLAELDRSRWPRAVLRADAPPLPPVHPPPPARGESRTPSCESLPLEAWRAGAFQS